MWIRLYQFLSSLIHFAKSDRNSTVLHLPHAGFWLYVHMFKTPKTVSSKVTKYHTFSTTSQIVKKKKKKSSV